MAAQAWHYLNIDKSSRNPGLVFQADLSATEPNLNGEAQGHLATSWIQRSVQGRAGRDGGPTPPKLYDSRRWAHSREVLLQDVSEGGAGNDSIQVFGSTVTFVRASGNRPKARSWSKSLFLR